MSDEKPIDPNAHPPMLPGMREILNRFERDETTTVILLAAQPALDGAGFYTTVRGAWDASVVPALVMELLRRTPTDIALPPGDVCDWWKAIMDATAALVAKSKPEPTAETKH